MTFWDERLFERFIGDFNPVVAIAIAGCVGLTLLLYLKSNNWFFIHRKNTFKQLISYTGWVIIFASIAILIDLINPFSSDINILFPKSLLFYPVIAFFVEVVFHVFPLAIVLTILSYF